MSKLPPGRVKVHTCRLEKEVIPFKAIQAGSRYVIENIALEYEENYYQKLAPRCRCRKTMKLFDADKLVARQEAFRAIRCKRGKIFEDEYQIWMPMVRVTSKTAKVPRIDLITSADIERAYVDERKAAIRLINDIHKMHMEERVKLIVPFRPDPFEGRALFPFSPDERTYGGIG